MRTSPPLPVVLALTALIEGLFEAVGARFGIFPIRGPLVRFLWKRLFRIQRHFTAIAARFAAGRALPARRPRSPASRTPRDATAFRLGKWVNPKFGWLCRVVPGYFGASAFARDLHVLLTTDPDMLALLAATPATARVLRPLCWMLGVPAPPLPVFVESTPHEPLPEPTGAEISARPDAIAAIPRPIVVPVPPDPPDVFSPVPVLRAA